MHSKLYIEATIEILRTYTDPLEGEKGERVYLPLYKVADTPFHIQGDKLHADY